MHEIVSASIKENHGICPFCGENYNSLSLSEDKNLYWVYCKNCFANGPSKATQLEAINAWKTFNINSNKE